MDNDYEDYDIIDDNLSNEDINKIVDTEINENYL